MAMIRVNAIQSRQPKRMNTRIVFALIACHLEAAYFLVNPDAEAVLGIDE